MNILNNFDIKANFWQVNPQLKIPAPFNKLYEDDKTKDKHSSSQIMWAIALTTDPSSKFFNITLEDRRTIIARDYLKDIKFDFNAYKECIDFYERMVLTPAQRQLTIWSKKLDEKTELLSRITYNESNSELIEKLLISNTKLFGELQRISEALVKEGEDGIVKGGSEESISEKGEI